jgi:CubicO group peptidase (beta-lactamase class C family)
LSPTAPFAPGLAGPAATATVDHVKALEMVADWPVGAGSVRVLDREGVVGSVGPEGVLPWASVTKLLTALTALVAVDRGVVGLDNPAGPPGATVRHLLAHAAGIAAEGDAVLAAPGRRRIYSNRGFELLAGHLENRTGRRFADLLQESVLDPLGMTGTHLVGSPAAGARGPVGDLAALGRELLSPTLVPALMPEATRTAFPGLPGVLPGFGRQEHNDWGLGFEIRDGKQPHWTGRHNSPETFGHFGQSGSFLWVDPAAGLACACLTDRQFGEWAARCWPELSDAVLDEAGRSADLP